MKLVIFTPFARSSAIGRVTALIVKALLQQGHSAVVIRTEQESLLLSPTHGCEAEVIPWTDAKAVRAAVDDADALVYQIGNNYAYHCGGLHWLAMLPGIVCLHDFLVAHLFMEWAQGRRAQAERVLTEWYDADAATEFFSPADSEAFIERAGRLFPMTEWICSMALAVVSHSHWGMRRVANSCPGPLRVLPLPYDAPSCTRHATTAGHSDGSVNVLTVGHVNPNKRIDSVIRAIGSSTALRSTVRYRLCGLIEPRMAVQLTALAHAHGVNLEISGETDSVVLQGAMNDADIVCCLRWPSLEAASATTIEGLLYGKAVVVTDAAFYSELPDDCVQKISVTDEIAELRAALEHLCANTEARRAMAMRGQEWATRTFSATSYAEQLEDLVQLVATASPAINMAGDILNQMSEWGASAALMTAEDMMRPLDLFCISGQPDTGVAGS